VSLKKAQFREFNEIFDELPTCLNELSAEYPSHMRPPHAIYAWWMNILLGIRELMVVAVV
jgi:hypothetical protein